MTNTINRNDFTSLTASFESKFFEREEILDGMIESLNETESWEKRRCPLNALFMFHFVLFMAFRRAASIGTVLDLVTLMMRKMSHDVHVPLKVITDEAVIKARYRLGAKPVKFLFEKLTSSIKVEPSLFGRRVYGIDGVHLTMPDTVENEEKFGKPKSGRGKSAFPQTKMTLLVATDTHQVVDAYIGPGKHSERAACASMLKKLGEDDLVIMDRGISATWIFDEFVKAKVDFIGRISNGWKPIIIKKLGQADWLVELVQRVKIPKTELQAKCPKTRTVTVRARLIEGKTKKGKLVRLITSLDHYAYSAKHILLAYHSRWENEIAYDELKTHFFSVKHGTLHTIFRSKKPEGVQQEAYSMLIAYNAVRSLMCEAAEQHGLNPLSLSFVKALEVIKEALPYIEVATLKNALILLQQLLDDLAACKIDRPRRNRRNPRKVRVKMSKYNVKSENEKGEKYNTYRSVTLNDVPIAKVAHR